ncbi:MAG TPA: hypothetical protein VN894_17300 [Polyangiaceae bacterium]|nr:hypothetical protein [Polyangiaceae bacterium]
MAIVGHPLESGVRVAVERQSAGGPPWQYAGEAVTKGERFRLAAKVDADGAVTVEMKPEPPAGLVDKVRLIVRAAWKHAADDGTAPPRRIARWRADR